CIIVCAVVFTDNLSGSGTKLIRLRNPVDVPIVVYLSKYFTFSGYFNDVALLWFESLLQKFRQMNLSHETQTLGILFACGNKADLCGEPTYFRFAQLTQREK